MYHFTVGKTPETIEKLVEQFDRNIDSYKSPSYNETKLRVEFVNPFWKTLGWDVENVAGYAMAYRDVIHEDAIKVGASTKAPDYCFRIGGARKFFLETKRPSVNLKKDSSPAYQLRRYAWSCKLPLSILTDFEEMAVYDCLIRPKKNDRASKARITYFTYTDYVEKWNEIEPVFSREAVLKGSFDKYAESARGKRGTSDVDSEFLKEIENWRDTLAANIAIRNPKLSVRELNFAVQKTIDRIIFLRMCEDRGIEQYAQLQALCAGKRMYPRLLEIFEKADEKYNSGLFHFKEERGRMGAPDKLTPKLKIDDAVLKGILINLYYPESPYEFSILPPEILGNVYEQFLGKVIRLTKGHRAKVEEKPEVRKAGGVYYTPQYIVDYIVENTVGKLCEGKTPKQISKLRILDPACGSGSFLLGAYKRLIDYHLKWYIAEMEKTGKVPLSASPSAGSMLRHGAKGKRKKAPAIFQGRGGEWLLTTREKKRILLNNIFGVDIDAQAVEVTKLSLLLKVLENENSETIATQLTLWRERALPDLSNNIKCGNSLIGPDFYDKEQMTMFDEEEQYRINAFDWEDAKLGFGEIMKTGGFDCVIGNPPYVRQEILGQFKDYFKQHYQAWHGTADLYAYFIERGVSLLKPEGVFSYIVANKWMRVNYGANLRRWLKNQNIEEIVDFVDLPIFKKATTYTCIIRVRKGSPSSSFNVVQVKTLDFDELGNYVNKHKHLVSRTSLNDEGWSLVDKSTDRLLGKLRDVGIPLSQYVKGEIYYGVKTGLNKAFVIDAKTRSMLIKRDKNSTKLIKPFLVGQDVKRYFVNYQNRYLIFTRRGISIDEYVAIKEYLQHFKTELMPKPKGHKGKWSGRKPGPYQWYEIQDTVAYWKEFEKPKIIWPGISAEVTAFAFDELGYYGNDNNQLIVSSDRYLLGILNSTVSRFFLTTVCDKVQGGFYRLKIIYIEQLPIRPIDFSKKEDVEKHDRMVALVEEMLGLHRKLPAAKTPNEKTRIERRIAATDGRIDSLVYELYELTDDEIKIVEESE